MDTQINTLPESILAATEQLAAAVLRTEPLVAYQQAKVILDADAEAQEILARFAKAQTELRVNQSRNAVSQAEMDELRALQRQVRGNDKIMEYARTQQDAITYLPVVNTEISQLLGIDFAALAKPASC